MRGFGTRISVLTQTWQSRNSITCKLPAVTGPEHTVCSLRGLAQLEDPSYEIWSTFFGLAIRMREADVRDKPLSNLGSHHGW